MSEELKFTLRRDLSIRDLMDVFRAHFQELRGKRVAKYVLESEKMYILMIESGNLTAAVLLKLEGGGWSALISPERLWNEEASFLVGGESILKEVKDVFLLKCVNLITVLKPWTSYQNKGESEQTEDDYVTPFYSELSEEGTLARCPKCGAEEIIFPNLRTCTKCGTEIVKKSNYFELNEPTKEIGVPPTAAQEEAPEVGKCIVCRMSIHRGEPVAYCPNCAGKGHRAHLLEYVHVKGECPSCHEHITEEEVANKDQSKRIAGKRDPL